MGVIIDDPSLREKSAVFTDRHDAGRRLGELLSRDPGLSDPLVLAIPAGGVPVGVEISIALHAPLALAVVRKIQVPGNTEAGFGAVAWDGRIEINEDLRQSLGLTRAQVNEAIRAARENVRERMARFTGGKLLPGITGRTVILTDDGLASGFTMLAAVRSLYTGNPGRVIVAVPTASDRTAEHVAREVDELVCLNIRGGGWFAVADAYRRWHDLDEDEVISELIRVSR
jgi:putative phosphoribosyl transferase